MEVIELRYGKEDGYKVQFIDELPKNKIIIALHSKSATAFLVTQANNYQCNKGLDMLPITQFEKTNRLEFIKIRNFCATTITLIKKMKIIH